MEASGRHLIGEDTQHGRGLVHVCQVHLPETCNAIRLELIPRHGRGHSMQLGDHHRFGSRLATLTLEKLMSKSTSAPDFGQGDRARAEAEIPVLPFVEILYVDIDGS